MQNKKRLAVFAFLCLLAGAFCLGIGIALRGSMHDAFGVRFGQSGLFGIGMFGEEDENQTLPTTVSMEDVKSIQLDIERGDIKIKQGKTLSFTMKHVSSDDYEWSSENGKLDFTYETSSGFHLFQFPFGEEEPEFELTIPQGYALNEIKITSNMGDVTLENITAKTIDLTQHMGDIECHQVFCEETLDMKQNMGDVTYKGSHPGNMSIENDLGNIEIDIKDNPADYRYELSTSMGNLEINDHEFDGFSVHESGGSDQAKYTITANNNMGDIALEFH